MIRSIILIIGYLLINYGAKAQKLIILSKADENSAYRTYLLKADATLILKSAFHQSPDSILCWLKQASGIVITGGEDIHPVNYHKESELSLCGKIDTYRDSLERVLFQYAFSHCIPYLGICRGEQMLNVALGGSLIRDIPKQWKGAHSHIIPNDTAKHPVRIIKSSKLYQITHCDSAVVNSFHHQCVENIAEKLNISAYADDGIPEAIESIDNDWKAIGIQWHPERLDFNHPLSGNIIRWFLN